MSLVLSDISKLIAQYRIDISELIARVCNEFEIIGIGRIEIALNNSTCSKKFFGNIQTWKMWYTAKGVL